MNKANVYVAFIVPEHDVINTGTCRLKFCSI